MRIRRVGTAGAVATLLAISACGPATVARADVEQRAAEELAAVVGQQPDRIDCPDDLTAEVGAEMRCELFDGGQSIGLTVTVTSIDGSNVKFDVLVDELQ